MLLILRTTVTLGKVKRFQLEGGPDILFKVERFVINVPAPEFIRLRSVNLNNNELLHAVDTLNGADAFIFGPSSMGIRLHLPALNPKSNVVLQGEYSGIVPPGFKKEDKYDVLFTWSNNETPPREIGYQTLDKEIPVD